MKWDCRIIVENRIGEVEEFDPSETGHAEAMIIQERHRLLGAYPDEDPWPRLKPFIRSLRQFANAANGYSIVHPTLSWHFFFKQCRLQSNASVFPFCIAGRRLS